MTILLALLLVQTAPNAVTVPEPNPELDAAHACLVAETKSLLTSQATSPSQDERWRLAVSIAGACETELDRAADSPEAKGVADAINHTSLTKRQQLRAEANYYVDRLIREHFEAKS